MLLDEEVLLDEEELLVDMLLVVLDDELLDLSGIKGCISTFFLNEPHRLDHYHSSQHHFHLSEWVKFHNFSLAFEMKIKFKIMS